jgi:hypothetical protein
MADIIKINNLSEVFAEYIKAKIRSDLPNTDLTENSPLLDVLIYPWATLAAQIGEFGTSVELRTNLSNVSNLSETDIDEIGDGNYFLPRALGARAFGSVTFNFDSISPIQDTVIPEGVKLKSSKGLFFTVTETIIIPPSAMYAKWDANGLVYSIDAAITADDVGTAYNVNAGDITEVVWPFSSYTVRVINNKSIEGGSNKESDEAYLSRIRSFYSSRTLETEKGYEQQILENFAGVKAIKVVGHKHPLMMRDLAESITIGGVTLENVHIGGKVDIYVAGTTNAIGSVIIPNKASNIVPLSKEANLIDAQSVAFTNASTSTPISEGDISVVPNSEGKLVYQINGGYTENQEIRATYRWSPDGSAAAVVNGTLTSDSFLMSPTKQTSPISSPFLSCVTLKNLRTGEVIETGGGHEGDYYGVFYEGNDPENEVTTVDPFLGTSGERSAVAIFDTSLSDWHGDPYEFSYSYASTIKQMGDFYNRQENRVITRDVIILKAKDVGVRIEFVVKLNSGAILTASVKNMLFNSVNKFFATKTLGATLEESDIIGHLYQDPDVMSTVDHIAVPFRVFSRAIGEETGPPLYPGDRSLRFGEVEFPILDSLDVYEGGDIPEGGGGER